ncbi:MAG: hypothetical protein FJ275_05215, partial [Planctomycetes bacterium]|nr:hypothetical protein [Planctomycetota bacterium]
MKGSDADMRAVALERLRDGLKGEAYTVELAEKVLPGLKPDVQVLLLSALAGRGDAAAVPGIVKVSEAGDAVVAPAASRAIASLGGAAQVPMLVGRLDGEKSVGDAARAALVAIQGDEVAARLVAAAADGTAPPSRRAAILEVLADRRERAAIDTMVAAAVATDATVRAAAMRSLARLGGPAEVPGLVAGFLAAAAGKERDDAERAVLQVCGQGPETKAASASLWDAYRAARGDAQDTLLPLVSRVGLPDLLPIVDALVADPDPARRARGLAALARWPDATVKDRLLGLLAKTEAEPERRLLVGALIRIAPLPKNGLTDAQKLELLAGTLKLCSTDDERRRLLERAGA